MLLRQKEDVNILVADKKSEELAYVLSKTTGLTCVNYVPSEAYLLIRNKLVYFMPNDNKFPPVTFDLYGLMNQKHSRVFRNKKDILYKAIGFSRGCCSIVDVTAGMGWDSLCMWNMGRAHEEKLKLYAVERNPVIYSLLYGAITFLKEKSEQWQGLHVCYSESLFFINQLNGDDRPDVIFLDPMFPEKKKRALPRKEIQLFNQLGCNDIDSTEVLAKALKVARKRVVVKRPLKAQQLLSGAHLSFKGKLIRFDIYLTSNK